MKTVMLIKSVVFFFASIILLPSCNRHYTPKPNGYPRIEFPDRVYGIFESSCPFTFEKPTYALMVPDTNSFSEPCWYNMHFPNFDATLHMSYKHFTQPGQVDSMMEDSYNLVMKHTVKAEDIEEREIRDSSGIQGMFYDLYGNTATPFSFFLTDKKHHFIRGAFYFNNHTSRDSVAPVIDFAKEDIIRMIGTMRFKD